MWSKEVYYAVTGKLRSEKSITFWTSGLLTCRYVWQWAKLRYSWIGHSHAGLYRAIHWLECGSVAMEAADMENDRRQIECVDIRKHMYSKSEYIEVLIKTYSRKQRLIKMFGRWIRTGMNVAFQHTCVAVPAMKIEVGLKQTEQWILYCQHSLCKSILNKMLTSGVCCGRPTADNMIWTPQFLGCVLHRFTNTNGQKM